MTSENERPAPALAGTLPPSRDNAPPDPPGATIQPTSAPASVSAQESAQVGRKYGNTW